MFAIVGSGFGLYGYLPAVADTFPGPVLLPEGYRAKVDARRELDAYRDRIQWARDADAALRESSAVVIATPPRRQVEVAGRCLALPGIRSIVLEKPLAPDASEAAALLEALRRSGRRYRLAYTFLHTSWAGRLAWPAAPAPEVTITWTFMAHHFAHELRNWKRLHAEGGGPLRFFGIHLLGLLAHLGYREVRRSSLEGPAPGEFERWDALFSGPGLPECRVQVDTRCAKSMFRIAAGEPLVDLSDPYAAEPAPGEVDRRVAVLKRFLATLHQPDASLGELYGEVVALWRAAEAAAAE